MTRFKAICSTSWAPLLAGAALLPACNIGVVNVPLEDSPATADAAPTDDASGAPPTDDRPAGGSNLAMFTDPHDPTFTTSDVRDVDEEIVRFDTQTRSLIWTDGMAYQSGSWSVNGNLLMDSGFFQVRFGTKDGEKRAYFTETATATLCDIALFSDGIRIFATSVPVPQE